MHLKLFQLYVYCIFTIDLSFKLFNISGDENFQEVVATLINDDFDLTKEAMHLMNVHAGVEFGVGFAKTHNIPEDWLPSDVQRWLKNGPQMTIIDEDWEVETSSSTQSIFRKVKYEKKQFL